MTKQQLINQLNALTNDPNEEIFGWWEGATQKIHGLSLLDAGDLKILGEEYYLPYINKPAKSRIIIDCDY